MAKAKKPATKQQTTTKKQQQQKAPAKKAAGAVKTTAKAKAPAKKPAAKAKPVAKPKKTTAKAAPTTAAKAKPKASARAKSSPQPKSKASGKGGTKASAKIKRSPEQLALPEPTQGAVTETPIAATDEPTAMSGAPMLPRERSADPLRRSRRSRAEGGTPAQPDAESPATAGAITSTTSESSAAAAATQVGASTAGSSAAGSSAAGSSAASAVTPPPAARAPAPPVSDPTWGALPATAPRSAGEFADFWSSPEPARPSTPAGAGAPYAGVPYAGAPYAGGRPQQMQPRPQHAPNGPSQGALQPGASQSGGQAGASQHGPAADPLGGPGGEGRRRRRRRRRRGGGRELETSSDGQPVQLDPIVRRLRRQFNLRDFRPGQEQVIRDLLAGKDVLAIMPTGAGKSLTYQLTAFELPGVTIVVSPLLALMSDQVEKLRRTGAVAARLDSTEGVKAKRETLERIDEGRHKIIYVTPERAASGTLLKELGGQKVALFVIDEAHCVSEWGHDFRPAYLAMRTIKEALPSAYPDRRPPVLALTATATPKVAEDILKQLDLKEPDLVHTGFNRPSLTFEVRFAQDLRQQVRRLLRLIRRIKGPGIVYCSTVRDVEALHGALPKLGLRVGMYHGRMTSNEREESQRSFMRNNPRIMIATNAFGLGVDKPDIRFVIHYNVPGSIEQYYQEAGRAGRDGKGSRCILLYNPNDEAVQEFFVGDKYPTKAQFKSVAFALSNGAAALKEIAIAGETSQQKARVVLGVLKDQGFAVEEEEGWRELKEVDDLTLGRAAEEYRKRREADRGKLEAMIRYARSTRCRVKSLLDYFGEKDVPLCGRCDNCKKYGADAAVEKLHDIGAPLSSGEMIDEEGDDDREPLPEVPQAPPPPRKDPTHHF